MHGERCSWSDGKVQRLEKCLNSVVAGLIKASSVVKAKRLEWERREREWEEERRRREELRIKREEEQAKLDQLLKQTQDWVKAQEVRAFVTAVNTRGSDNAVVVGGDIEVSEWSQWASTHADRFDPLVTSPASVLDEKIERYW